MFGPLSCPRTDPSEEFCVNSTSPNKRVFERFGPSLGQTTAQSRMLTRDEEGSFLHEFLERQIGRTFRCTILKTE